ncbi:Dihydropteroate synthase-like protein [Naematelia encephala]|uniref:Dihydropteroate synthase-like protein n=1 Tax=Naematelia encephala TaxID=71784 RepID=A0A1Y2AF01_9TREE|nr:Dihydropteroate synthase-like protein [Naematelia encephala]
MSIARSIIRHHQQARILKPGVATRLCAPSLSLSGNRLNGHSGCLLASFRGEASVTRPSLTSSYHTIQRNNTAMPDTIKISDLSLPILNGVGPSAFNLSPAPPCPVSITVEARLNAQVVPACVGEDNMSGLGVNYSSLSKDIIASVSPPDLHFASVADLIELTGRRALVLGPENVDSVRVTVEMPKASLVADKVIYSAVFSHTIPEGKEWTCQVKDVRVMALIGLHPHERKEKQRLECDVLVEGYADRVFKHKEFADEVYKYLEASCSGTLEALVENFAQHLLETSRHLQDSKCRITITIRKPSALPFAIPEISITRCRTDYAPLLLSSEKEIDKAKRIFIAVGSNLGDRVSSLTKAISMLGDNGVKVVDGGRWYESEPMYEEDQDRFINTVIEVRTELEPLELLKVLKKIEKDVGRTKTYRNGPRVVDLDLLMYGSETVRIGQSGDKEDEYGIGWLEVPHKSIREREFVVRPFADIAPTLRHPSLGLSLSALLARLQTSLPSPLAPIIPLSYPCAPLRLGPLPLIMQIFNATPDSFSDGSVSHLDIAKSLDTIESFFSTPHPPSILDVGGMSTRPGSEPCTESEELERVVPLIQAIRASSNPSVAKVVISIDTYRPNVARAAIQAGGNIINDVRGGTEPGMVETMAKLDVPVILMHSRGDSKTMTTSPLQDYSNFSRGVVEGVQVELGEMIHRALRAGVKRWNIIVDPGLGFAKSHKDHLTLLRHLEEFTQIDGYKYPLLVGASRKGFVGRVTGRKEPKDRAFGDAAITAWCCRAACVDIVRVHEGRGMAEVVSMWGAMSSSGAGGEVD